MSGAEGRRGEGISRRGELLASKGNETKSSALPHVAWNACLRAIGGGGGSFRWVRPRNWTRASAGRKRHCSHRCFFKSWQVGQRSKAGSWPPTPDFQLAVSPTPSLPAASAPLCHAVTKGFCRVESYQKGHCPSPQSAGPECSRQASPKEVSGSPKWGEAPRI